ncbi:hypothetical protein [Spirosoma panaciterrae]|uniref:hypothetical protein n=1 Tax=Spirosoma panaciterrae TaxID=496058 RepID=UPI00035C87B7|nr:hypothetical protein [Spirosoma panaciterrae]
MNTSATHISELALSGVHSTAHRFMREITPAQEGLLDCCSHISAQDLVDSLNWILAKIREESREELTLSHLKYLASVDNLKDWLSDLVDERN